MVARRVAKQILGTVVAVAAGWLAALVFYDALAAIDLLQRPHYIVREALIVGPIAASIYMAYFIIPVWVAILIPLYLFVPSSSRH